MHPLGSQDLDALQVWGAAYQGDQQLTRVAADSQGQMAQATPLAAVPINRPVTGLKIRLKRCDQSVQARIKHRAAIHIDNFVGARAIKASPQPPVLAALKRDNRPVAIAEPFWRCH